MTPQRAGLLLFAAAATWGVSFVVVKDALSASSPLLFVSVRFALAAAVLAPFAGLGVRFTRSELGAGLLLTVLLATGFAAHAVGLQYTTPARSGFIVGLSSILAPVVAFLVLRQRPGWVVGVAFVFAGIGMYYLTAPDGGGLNRGDLWTLITAVVFGGHIVAVTELSRRHDARRLVWLQLAGTAVGVAITAALLEPLRLDPLARADFAQLGDMGTTSSGVTSAATTSSSAASTGIASRSAPMRVVERRAPSWSDDGDPAPKARQVPSD